MSSVEYCAYKSTEKVNKTPVYYAESIDATLVPTHKIVSVLIIQMI